MSNLSTPLAGVIHAVPAPVFTSTWPMCSSRTEQPVSANVIAAASSTASARRNVELFFICKRFMPISIPHLPPERKPGPPDGRRGQLRS